MYYWFQECNQGFSSSLANSFSVWRGKNVEVWQGEGKHRRRGQAEGGTTITTVSKQMLIGGHWRFKLCRERKKSIQMLRNSSDANLKRTQQHIHTNTPAGAAVPTESGWRDKCAPKARLKGSLREKRLWQKCTPRDFLIPLTFVLVYASVQAVHSDLHMLNFHASRSALLGLTQTHTHTRTLRVRITSDRLNPFILR